MNVGDLIRQLRAMPIDTPVVIHEGNAQSRGPRVRLGKGVRSSYLYTLPEVYFGPSDDADSFPVVWL